MRKKVILFSGVLNEKINKNIIKKRTPQIKKNLLVLKKINTSNKK
jgi:hypothetical protein